MTSHLATESQVSTNLHYDNRTARRQKYNTTRKVEDIRLIHFQEVVETIVTSQISYGGFIAEFNCAELTAIL